MKSVDSSAEVEMQIRGLMMDPLTNMPVVVLMDTSGEAVLPIWVGPFEANAISEELEKGARPRPTTHDLLLNITRGLNAVVRRVVVTEMRNDTYFAVIWMEQAGETVAIDARPSDAIALAMRWYCPVYASRAVLESAKQIVEAPANLNPEEMRKLLENLNDDDLGRYKM
jgi:bifunctional DNase/RNase